MLAAPLFVLLAIAVVVGRYVPHCITFCSTADKGLIVLPLEAYDHSASYMTGPEIADASESCPNRLLVSVDRYVFLLPVVSTLGAVLKRTELDLRVAGDCACAECIRMVVHRSEGVVLTTVGEDYLLLPSLYDWVPRSSMRFSRFSPTAASPGRILDADIAERRTMTVAGGAA